MGHYCSVYCYHGQHDSCTKAIRHCAVCDVACNCRCHTLEPAQKPGQPVPPPERLAIKE